MKIVFLIIVTLSILAFVFWALAWVFVNAIDNYLDYSDDRGLEDLLGGKQKDQDWDDNKQHTEQDV